MSGDLEDFLRRAAQRRQAKGAPNRPQAQARSSGTARGASSTPRAAPQYSDRFAERVVQQFDDDEVLMAEVVEDEEESISARLRRLEAAKKAAAEAQAEVARRQAQQRSGAQGTPAPEAGSTLPSSGSSAQELLKLLKQPGGLQQSILLKEILDRPQHRW